MLEKIEAGLIVAFTFTLLAVYGLLILDSDWYFAQVDGLTNWVLQNDLSSLPAAEAGGGILCVLAILLLTTFVMAKSFTTDSGDNWFFRKEMQKKDDLILKQLAFRAGNGE